MFNDGFPEKIVLGIPTAFYRVLNLLQTGDTKIKQLPHFRYLVSVLTEDGKCDIEMRRGIDSFQKLRKVVRSRKPLL